MTTFSKIWEGASLPFGYAYDTGRRPLL